MGIVAAAEAASKSSGGSALTFPLLIVLVFVGFYFLMIRPQRRRQQQVQQQQRTVAPGALVRTTAGMYATVTEVDGDDVVLEVAPGVEVRYLKRAIMEVITPGETAEDDESAEFDEHGSLHDDVDDEETDGTPEDSDDVKSAEDSHDADLARSDKDNVH
jgi:preprotein translocase subunit YajC